MKKVGFRRVSDEALARRWVRSLLHDDATFLRRLRNTPGSSRQVHRALTTRLQKLFSNGAQAWEISRTVEALERLQYHRDRFGKQCKASIPRPIRWLEAVDLMIPRRLSQEDLGDALELVGMLHRRAAPAWKVWAVTLSRIVWILLSAAGEVIAAVRGNTGSKKETK